MVDDQVLIGGIFAVIGVVILYRSISSFREFQSIDEHSQTTTAAVSTDEPAQQLIEGQLEVTEAVNPSVAPEEVSDSVSQPGIWAWRIQRKEPRSSGSGRSRYRWRTVDGELAVGEITIYANGRSIALSDEIVHSLTVEPDQSTLDAFGAGALPGSTGGSDPFDNDSLYLDDTTRVNLDEGGFLEEIIPDWVTVSVGQQTSDPNRYETAVLENGDRVWITGSIERTREGEVITKSQQGKFRLLDQDPDTVRQSLKKKAIRYGIVGVLVTLIGVGLGSGLLPAN